MCGINVLINSKGNIEELMEYTHHRGPDQSAFSKIGSNVFIAANRLRILDLTDASNQPFWNQEKTEVLIWNGALYNYQDLRNELLELGIKFKTNSDSEVFLYWLSRHGTTKLDQLKGMFSFVFANLETKQLIIARDPSGEKPLYFYNNANEWAFSSEASSLHKIYLTAIDQDQFRSYFYLRHTHPEKTFYNEICQVVPGNALIINFDGIKESEINWEHPKTELPKPHTQNQFEELLKDAVLKNFHAERPSGMVLSGGADSSLIYALWYEETGVALPTFTASLDKKYQNTYTDPLFAKKLQNKYPSLHHEIPVTLSVVKENWTNYIASLDQPIGDSASLMTWLIAKEATSQVKVLLSGAGADELFGGYQRHLAYKKFLEKEQTFRWIARSGMYRILPTNYRKLFSSIEDTNEETYIQMAALEKVDSQFLKKLVKAYPISPYPYKNALNWDQKMYLINDILKVHDNTCMAHGIEGRSPYLAFELIALSKSMSEEQHMDLCGKKWIKEALTNRGHAKIANRKKLGFGLPLKEWARDQAFIEWIKQPLHEFGQQYGSFLPEKMRTLSLHPEKAQGRDYLQLWNLMVLASWLTHNSE